MAGEAKKRWKTSLKSTPMRAVGMEPTRIIKAIFTPLSKPLEVEVAWEEVFWPIALREPLIMKAKSPRKTKNTAMRVPTCTAISKKSCDSWNPSRCWASTRCPELLIGRNSVIPCKAPRKKASRTFID
jgi:hypothetical protein